MALTRVSRHIIDDPFNPTTVSATDVTTTNINASGIGTVGTLRVTGDLTVEGTTTTLDSIITEVDRLEVSANSTVAAGIITQTGSGDILRLYDGASEVFSVADGGDVSIIDKIVHAGDTNTAIRFPAADTITAETDGSERLRITSDGNVGIGTDIPQRKLHTLGSQSNTVRFENSATNDAFIEYKGTTGTSYAGHTGNDFVIAPSSTEKLRITSGGKVRVPDGGKFVAGAGDDLQIYHDGTNSLIKSNTNELKIAGKTRIVNNGNTESIALFEPNGGATLFYDNSSKFETTSTGISVTGQVNASTMHLTDGNGIHIGNSNDLRIFHDGSQNAINSYTSNPFNIISNGDTTIKTNNNDNMAVFKKNNAVELYYDNDLHFATTSLGCKTNGDLSFRGDGDVEQILFDASDASLKFTDHKRAKFGNGDDLQIFHDGSNNYIQSISGNLILKNNSVDYFIGNNSTGSVELNYNNSKKFETTTTGAKVTGALEVTQEYPTIRPTLDLNFAATKTLDRRITFTRDSIGTYTDDMGILKYASNNVPRFDHDPITHESLGLLIEESRTNRFVNSIPGTVWSKTNVGSVTTNTTTANYATAPDGTTTATRWQWSIGNTTSDRAILRQGTGSLGSSTLVTLSIYLKSNTGSNQLAALHADGGISAPSYVTVTPEWKRFRYTYTSAVGINNGLEVKGGLGLTRQGDILVWGAQMEIGGFPTSYIPTYGSTVTRAADFATIKGTNFTDFYNQTEGTLFGEFTIKDTTYSSAAIANINQEPGASYAYSIMFVEVGTANGYFGRTYKNSSGVNISNASSVLNSLHPSTTPQKVSFGYTTVSGGELRAYWNGNNVNGSSDLSKVPTTLTNMRIGRGWSGGDVINAHIRKLSYYNKRLPNAQLQGLTQQ